MKRGSLLALVAGLVLLGLVVAHSDLGQVAHLLAGIEWSGVVGVVALFCLAWAVEILAWALTFTTRPVGTRWLWQLWRVNMVGEAMNVVMPLGSLGGEPIKAWLLKRHYQVGYREAATTLVLMQTLLALAEALFVALGALLACLFGILPAAIEHLLSSAAVVLAVAMAIVVIGLHRRWLRGLLEAFEQRFGGARFARLKDSLVDVEHALADFARTQPHRFTASTVLFLGNWLGGAAELWLILQLLEAPLPFASCWVAEAAIVTIRSLTFFLPAQLGSVEAVTVFVISALGGGGELGLALSAVRRARELAWSVAGLSVGAAYQLDWRAARGG